jgi:hypothetical protein
MPGGGNSDVVASTSGRLATGGGRSMVQTGMFRRLAASAMMRAPSPRPEARENSPAMAMPGVAGPACEDGFGAAQPVACANMRRRKVAGRPRQSVCEALRTNSEVAHDGMRRIIAGRG